MLPDREAHGAHDPMQQTSLPLDHESSRAPATACHEMPQARFDAVGVGGLSDTELIALMLNTGAHGHDVLTIARQVVAEAGSIANLGNWTAADFRRMKGIGVTKAKQLVAMLEISRRMLRGSMAEKPILNRPELVAEFLKPHVLGLDIEKFWVMCLNRKNRLIKLVEVTSGTATSSLAHPREVFREAIRVGATAIICAHNHPSGEPSPSAADVQLTRQLRDASKAVDIDLVDHVILGRAECDPRGVGHYSFRASGVI